MQRILFESSSCIDEKSDHFTLQQVNIDGKEWLQLVSPVVIYTAKDTRTRIDTQNGNIYVEKMEPLRAHPGRGIM